MFLNNRIEQLGENVIYSKFTQNNFLRIKIEQLRILRFGLFTVFFQITID